jgi:nicotinamide-nucleotide amidase
MFPLQAQQEAQILLSLCRSRRLKIAVAESCTGGLLAALLTAIPGSSDVFECGFVTYSDQAKSEVLGVSVATLSRFGAVSHEVAMAMALGALEHSHSDISASITGIAGPGGGTAEKPVGLVYVVAARKNFDPLTSRLTLVDLDRQAVRLRSAMEALRLLKAQVMR